MGVIVGECVTLGVVVTDDVTVVVGVAVCVADCVLLRVMVIDDVTVLVCVRDAVLV